jgi:hypothetical protein
VNGELPIERAANLDRIEEGTTTDFDVRNEPLPLPLTKGSQARARRFVREDRFEARLWAYKASGEVVWSRLVR